VDPSAPELDEREDVERPEPGGLDGEEVARDDPVRLGPEEFGPARSGPSWGRTRSGSPEQRPDRRRAHADPELAQLASDPDAAPPRILPGQPKDELPNPRIDRRPSRPADPAVRPLPLHELAMPTEQGCRGDEEGDPAVPRDDPARHREEHPVTGPELRRAGVPLENPELVTEDEDLEVFGPVVSAMLATADEETDEGADQTYRRNNIGASYDAV
jgi:hypothetical protein